jgi:hypothetical protein
MGQKLTWGSGPCATLEFEVLRLLGAHQPCHQVVRDRGDAGVPLAHVVVVVLPGESHLVLRVGQFLLQVPEVLVGLEVRVALGDGEQPAQRRRQCLLGLPGSSRTLRGDRRGARGRDLLEGGLLVRGVALDRVDQVRDQVVTALQLHVDLCPRLLDLVP